MAEQCIVCLELLDSAEPLQHLQGDDPHDAGGLPADLTEPALAPTPLTAHTLTVNNTTTTIPATDADSVLVHLPKSTEYKLDNNDNIAVIQVCNHILHDSCLREWTVKANSCPFCRQAFHLVEVYDKIGGECSLFGDPSHPPIWPKFNFEDN